VHCSGADDRLTVEVCDRGLKRYTGEPAPAAGIDLKLRGLAPRRGMGLMMISQLVDEAGFTESHDGGNRFRLVLYFRKA
jgi:anti-sigma regulatory factor (Ser/Thr protein kinase)